MRGGDEISPPPSHGRKERRAAYVKRLPNPIRLQQAAELERGNQSAANWRNGSRL